MRQNLLSTFYSPLPSFLLWPEQRWAWRRPAPSDGWPRGGPWHGDDRRRPLRRASVRASEWPPFAFYTAKIHLISRWWTEGERGAAAKSMCSCNASQSVRPPPTEWPCPRPERSQMGGGNAILGRLLLLRRQRRVPRVQEREYVTAALTLVAI